ncbi:MAG: acyl carrier protein [Oscillatoriophycideae cyanobacterium NC_groundwater_1537_Pr4_S-0.65um_50_18]|nr:acyl carrier protein [Oscillatoriophycideae cyanobacterium NC_groundwater_1537_Pr4_S-0.65um_50_18]
MDRLEVMDTLKAILTDLGIPEESLCENTLLFGHLKLDSVEAVRLSLQLKRQLGIDLKLGTRQDMTLAQICLLAETAPFPQSS